VTAAAVFALLAERFGEDVSAWEEAAGREVKDGVRDAGFTVAPERLPEVMRALRDEPSLRFDFLQNVTAIDWPKTQVLEVVYHLFSYAHRHEIVVKTRAPRDNPRVPSVAGLWKNAGWLEREQYDLLGVVFEGHPDLRRLLMPDDWVGHPMRKDYREAAEYRGMPTTRPSPLDMLVGYDKAQGGAKPSGGAT
jgi:NADH-quinone oxidoreductase subunit C